MVVVDRLVSSSSSLLLLLLPSSSPSCVVCNSVVDDDDGGGGGGSGEKNNKNNTKYINMTKNDAKEIKKNSHARVPIVCAHQHQPMIQPAQRNTHARECMCVGEPVYGFIPRNISHHMKCR